MIPENFSDWVILDEVQKIPELLDVVHYLIEEKKIKFILTGSSARKLKKKGTNLLAGRALTYKMYPLTSIELGNDFDYHDALKWGTLPAIFNEEDKQGFLESYVMTYLEEEVKQEGLTRNLGAFSRFLESASFSQGSMLSISEVARSCAVSRKIAENYFSIIEDLLIAHFLPAFTKRVKRELIKSQKFYFFDTGIFRTIRPKGPLDSPEEIEGASLETLVLQELLAINDYFCLRNKIYYWRTKQGVEIDFVLYGEKTIIAIEVKRKGRIGQKDLKGLKLFLKDYPSAKAYLLYGGNEIRYIDNIIVLPVEEFFF
jgi:predicted AAA+ superfamily ATPase